MRILGISASLRNARFGRGSEQLVHDITSITSADGLFDYIASQTKVRADDVFQASGAGTRPFIKTYEILRRAKTERGLSNSEAALTAGLWGACAAGADIDHLGLAPYFPASGTRRRLGELRDRVLAADALLLSGPVYFGDRGSLAQEFIEFLRDDAACAAHVRDRVYGGIAVGAKRNGGQETTLIYQLLDLTNANMLAVGNDSETTSQYGGTAVAGDVGTLAKDRYGLDTALGTGRRVAQVAELLHEGSGKQPGRPVRIAIWLLQDADGSRMRADLERFCADVESSVGGVRFEITDMTRESVFRCLACDICPTAKGPREDYRCVVSAEQDFFQRHHADLVGVDAVIPAAYSPVNRSTVRSAYQRFVERTRYLRRDDYVFSNVLTAPLVISEVNSNQNLHIRMLTSLVRHHTILHHPLIGIEYSGKLLNWDFLVAQGVSFARNAIRVAAGCDATASLGGSPIAYNPIGYVISANKAAEDRAQQPATAPTDGCAPVPQRESV